MRKTEVFLEQEWREQKRHVAEQFNAYGRVDIFTGTLGKAFGGLNFVIFELLNSTYSFKGDVSDALVRALEQMRKWQFLKPRSTVTARMPNR